MTYWIVDEDNKKVCLMCSSSSTSLSSLTGFENVGLWFSVSTLNVANPSYITISYDANIVMVVSGNSEVGQFETSRYGAQPIAPIVSGTINIVPTNAVYSILSEWQK